MAAANESWVFRFFGVEEREVCRAADGMIGRYGLAQAESRSQGAETLLALTAPAPALRRARGLLRRTFRAGLYGTGDSSLAVCTARALVVHDKLLACADSLALSLLAPRLDGLAGMDKVFDFGAGSCADPDTMARMEAQAARFRGDGPCGPVWEQLCRLRAVLQVTRSDLAAGALSMGDKTLVAAAGHKGCWLYLVGPEENAALWLLDMLRRAASGSAQAAGVQYIRHGARPQEGADLPDDTPAEAPALPRRRRWPGRVALLLAALAAVALAAAWRVTGGDLAALPEVLRALTEGSQLPAHSGAALL